ncbi:DUF485 domain-containing protein [Nocardiopsis sp. HNM0947]|uniref:DUF485 domain-containing protein n=1 Tax=Nocardiopsis coralli TaxID=2772213 RepID=A0ABR9PBE6_9ACTN|nr:DUF485 domain-containing protein [Nocardiopsis coralli]MBE3001156.1 DUF485 domain-containing protein [Nocardiopsis coralli]
MSEGSPPNGPESPPDPVPQGDEPIPDSAYVAMHGDPRFVSLKRKLYTFIFPMSVAFLAWYLLYVFMSGFGRDIMGTVLFGNVNVALVFGLLQFVSTFGIAILYTRYARKKLDGDAIELRDELQNGNGGGGR